MLRLTARFTDKWNTALLGDPQERTKQLKTFWKACVEVEKDPTALNGTANVSVAAPDVGKTNPFAENRLLDR
jgi:hypothetical protein